MNAQESPNIFEQLSRNSDSDKFSDLTEYPKTQFQFLSSENETEKGDNIFETLAKEKPHRKFTFMDTAKDVAKQGLKGAATGLGGAYGNIAEATGLNQKEAPVNKEARQQRQNQEFDTLTRMQDPNYKPTLADIASLEGDEGPPMFTLPTGKQVKTGIEAIGGPGEAETPAGRIANRSGEFVGETAALGGNTAKLLLAAGGAGAAGQSIREAGGNEALATGVEIAGNLAPSVISKKLLPVGKEASKIVDAGRKLGLNENQITPLIQGENKVATLSKVARKGTKTKNLFESIKTSLGDSYNAIKSSPAAKVRISNNDQIKLTRDFVDIRNDLSKTLAPSPDKQAALDYIDKAIDTLRNTNVDPEYLVNFWQDINKSVKWNAISGGKKSLTRLKEPVSDILKKVSPGLAEDFELTNLLYTKYADISKKLKPNFIDALVNKGEILGAVPAALAMVHGNPWPLLGLGSESAVRILSREMLINPYFQNLGNKLVKNFNSNSIKAVKDLTNGAKEYLERKHPEENWSFLVDEGHPTD